MDSLAPSTCKESQLRLSLEQFLNDGNGLLSSVLNRGVVTEEVAHSVGGQATGEILTAAQSASSPQLECFLLGSAKSSSERASNQP